MTELWVSLRLESAGEFVETNSEGEGAKKKGIDFCKFFNDTHSFSYYYYYYYYS